MAAARELSDGEWERLCSHLAPGTRLMYETLFVVGCVTGFRVAELLSLTVGEVWHEGEVRPVLHVKAEHMKRGKKCREVKLAGFVREKLVAWLAYQRERGVFWAEDPLFSSARGKPLSYMKIYRAMKRAAAEAGIELRGVSTHSWRKSFGNRGLRYFNQLMIETKNPWIVPLHLVSQLMGHESTVATEKYLTVHADTLDAGIDAVARSFENLFGIR